MGLMQSVRHWLFLDLEERAAIIPAPLPSVDNYWPYADIGGRNYPLGALVQTLQGRAEPIGDGFEGLAGGAYKGNGVVFACLNARMSLFAEARFQYRRLTSGRPGELFGNGNLGILEQPWPGATTGDLLSRAMQYADLGGDAVIVRESATRVRMYRPDWTWAIHGSFNDANVGMWDPEAELLGWAYQPGGPVGGKQPVFYLAKQVAHFAPTPDPMAPARGMSWLTSLVREVEADSAMTSHKLLYMRNGATPNLIVTGVPGATPDAFGQWVEKFGKGHDGVRNAYKTLYLSGAVDAKVAGNDLAQVDFKVVQGAGETRIAAAAGVPPIVAGLSEGLQGSSLNAGNFQAAMRRFADITMRPLWRNMAGSLASIIPVPGGAELWYDDRDIPALKDDIKDAAEVQAKQAAAMRQLIDAGWEPESIVAATIAGDWKQLKHSGLYSVQLQPPQPEGPPEPVQPPAEEPAND